MTPQSTTNNISCHLHAPGVAPWCWVTRYLRPEVVKAVSVGTVSSNEKIRGGGGVRSSMLPAVLQFNTACRDWSSWSDP